MTGIIKPEDLCPIVKDGQPMTSSRAVAERFGKRHDDVLKAIRNLLGDTPDPTFGRRNFAESTYLNAQGKQQPEYHLTHDGFALLAMGFTGPKALAWKIRFLEAFKAMARALQSPKAAEATTPELMQKNWQRIAYSGKAVSPLHLAFLFIFEANKADSAMLLLLSECYGALEDFRYIPACDLVAASRGRIPSVTAVERGRERLIQRGFLEEAAKDWWRIRVPAVRGALDIAEECSGLAVHALIAPYLARLDQLISLNPAPLHDVLEQFRLKGPSGQAPGAEEPKA